MRNGGQQEQRIVMRELTTVALLWFVSCTTVKAEPIDLSFIHQAVQRGVQYLATNQQPNGGFLSFACQEGEAGVRCDQEQTIWVPTLISYALQPVQAKEVTRIQKGIVEFLQRTMEPQGYWRYWPKGHTLYNTVSPDVDDTACASLVLHLQHAWLPRNIQGLQRLQDPAGRFYTWVEPTALDPGQQQLIRQLRVFRGQSLDTMNDVDCVVNANALAYVAHEGNALPNVCTYLNRTVEQGEVPRCWLYGESAYLVYYTYARAYESGATCLRPGLQRIRQRVVETQRSTGAWGDDAEQAAALLSLLVLHDHGSAVEKGVRYLLSRQQRDGSWPATRFLDLAPTLRFHGSEALTTALALEALAKYLRAREGS